MRLAFALLWAIPCMGVAQLDTTHATALPAVEIRPTKPAWIGFQSDRLPATSRKHNGPQAIRKTAVVFPAALVANRTVKAIRLYLHPQSTIGGSCEITAYRGACQPEQCSRQIWSQQLTVTTTGWITITPEIPIQGPFTLLFASTDNVGLAIANSTDLTYGYVFTLRTGWQNLREVEYRPGKPVDSKPAVKVLVE